LLLRIPIPAFYFDATDEAKWVVIDGVQRLTAIARFVLDENMLKENLGSEIKQLKLCELEILRDLEGKTYNELESTLQFRVLETRVTLYTIVPGTPANVKYNIFKRINTSGVLLSPQEIRNTFNAEATGFLDALATSDEFLIATNWRVKDLRRDDQEYVLRFIAFTLSSYEEYENPDFDQFLRDAMAKLNQMLPDDRDKCEETFKNAMSAAHQIFGTDAFCKANAVKYLDEIDPALFEMWAVHLGQLSDDDRELLSERKEYVTHQFRHLLLNDTNLCEVSAPNQESPERLKQRFETVGDFINDMLRTEDPWENIEAKYPIGSAVTGKVVKVYRTGVEVELETDVQGFIETSELWKTISMDDEILRYGDKINLVVLDIDEAHRRISLSLKQHVEDKYEFGSMVEAKIVGLVLFGAIAELEKGVVGLIPGNNISSGHGNPELHINDTVMVLVLVIRNQNIVLSYKWHTQKQHSEQVWKSLSEKYPVGSEIRGQIVGMVPFGAFVELEDGLQGLIRRSELSWTKLPRIDSSL
jgi:predicted RNA-binding protein with RPS1 domain